MKWQRVRDEESPGGARVAIDELSRRRAIGVLLICCMSLFIVGLDITVVNVALPSIGRELHAGISGLQWTVGAYTVVHGEPAHALGLDGGPVRPQAHLRRSASRVFSVASLLCSLAPSVEPPRGVPRAPGGRRLDDEPGRDVDHHQHLHGPARAGSGGRRLGRRVRHLDGARADRGRHARLLGRLAVDLPDQPSRRARRDRPDAPLHPRVAGAEAAPVRSGRPGTGDRAAGDAHLRHHRSPEPRVVLGRHPGRVRGVGGGARGPAPLRAAPRRAAHRPAVLPVDPVRVVDRHLGGRVRRVRRLPLPEHAVPAGRTRALAGRGRARHRAHGRHDRAGVPAVGPDRRPPRSPPAARDLRGVAW